MHRTTSHHCLPRLLAVLWVASTAVAAWGCGGPTAPGPGDGPDAAADATSPDTAETVGNDSVGTEDDAGVAGSDGAAVDGSSDDAASDDAGPASADTVSDVLATTPDDAIDAANAADGALDAEGPPGDTDITVPPLDGSLSGDAADGTPAGDMETDTGPECGEDDDCAPAADADVCSAPRCVEGTCAVGDADDGATCDDGSLCTVDDSCTAGACAGAPVDCTDLDGLCLKGTCNAATGSCTVTASDEGLPCDDDDACTIDDVCAIGQCTGAPKSCDEPESPCLESLCEASSGECVTVPVPDAPCDDAEGCTFDDTCTDGACVGTPVVCEGEAALTCHVLACDAATGTCVEAPGLDGSECSDGDKCSTGDTCDAGTCSGTPLACDFLDAACKQGTCDSETGSCVQLDIPSGTPCDDGDNCTAADVCSIGGCVGQVVDCQDEAGPCDVGVCDSASGSCLITPLGAGTPCDDDNACTTADVCFSGACSGLPTDCSHLDGACQDGACDAVTGDCVPEPYPNFTVCDDGLTCTDADQCLNGACLGAGPDCSALNIGCLLGVCDDDGMGCKHIPAPVGAGCDDGDPCTSADACGVTGGCQGEPVECEDDTNPCIAGTCNAQTGECEAVPLEEGAACDDGNGCTEGDTCLGTVCVATPKDCTHLDSDCSSGYCSPAAGACQVDAQPDGIACNDDNLCTLFDSCTEGDCVGESIDCSALEDSCNTGKCDPSTAACFKSPKPGNGACNDLDPCTVLDQCDEGTCSGSAVDCSHLEGACIQAACNPNSGLCVTSLRPDGTPCDDGNACTIDGACSAAFCASDTIDCSALQTPCSLAQCDAATGLCYAQPKAEGTSCNDDDPCTLLDSCSEGECAGYVKDCSVFDGPCSSGICNAVNGFCGQDVFETGTACDDGDPCTGPDLCSGLSCVAPENPGLPECVGECQNPILVSDLPFTYADTTAIATDDFNASACGVPDAGEGSPDVLFQFTPPETAVYRIRMANLDFDPGALDVLLYLTNGCPTVAQSLCQGIADTQGQAGGDEITQQFGGGAPIFIVVDGSAGSPDDTGSYALIIEALAESETKCSDGIDDDGDGETDCDDTDCDAALECLLDVSDGALVFSEVMGHPGGSLADPSGEFIELTNPTETTTPSAGVWLAMRSWAEGEPEPPVPDAAWQFTGTAPIESGNTFLLARSDDAALNGAIAPSATWGDAFDIPNDRHVRLQLVQPVWDGTSNPTSGQRIDEIVVPAGTFDVAARSWSLDETVMADPDANTLNDQPTNWCLSETFPEFNYAGGNHGTPGVGNPPCPAP